jgi:MFS family permease
MQPNAVVADRPVGVSERIPGYSWYALALLTAVYVLNFLDRQLIYVLFVPIQKEMKFSDLELAMLGSGAFVLFYSVLGIPFGRLADRVSRKMLIGTGLAIWSLFSGLTGFAESFWGIFFCRLMVGVGEATLGPAALSLLSDYFPVRMRGTVNSIYASAIALGGGLAFFLGGWIGQSYGWRPAFYALGFPGLLLAVLVFFLREQPRGKMDAPTTAQTSDWRTIFRSKPLRFLFAGYALVGLASNNIAVWVTAFIVRVHEFDILTIGIAAGIVSLVVGIPAMIFAGVIADRVSRKMGGGRMAFTALTAVACVPLWLFLLFTNNVAVLIASNIVLYALAILWVGPATADVVDLVSPKLRGLAIGIFFSFVNVAAYLIGSPVIGKISDAIGVAADPEKMRYSLLVCPLACAVGAVMLWLGSRARRGETAA